MARSMFAIPFLRGFLIAVMSLTATGIHARCVTAEDVTVEDNSRVDALERPNVVLIMVDDFGYECVTANGGQSYQTPRIDALAARGIRFEHCHVQPLCTPTRVQMMTGIYNVRNYVQFGVLPRDATTFGHLMKQAGYATAVCGKWQLGRETDSPQHFGFDESCLWQHTRRPPRYANPGLEYGGEAKDFSRGEYGPTLVNDFALDFITRHRDRPFFLYYPMILTHDPFQPTPDSPDWDPTIKSERRQRDLKNFGEMTTYTDKMVGRVVDKLDELGIGDNTLLIFLGDNGTHRTVTSRFGDRDYPGGKGTTTARGTHVPLVALWPAAMASLKESPLKDAHVNTDLISSADFLPTICDAAGIDPPGNLDGVSFLPQLRGEAGTPRQWLYTWYSPRQKLDLRVQEYAFDWRFKLYRSGEFFDVRRDIDEADDLSGASLDPESLDPDAAAAKAKLQNVLDRFADARPKSLDEQFVQSQRVRKPGQYQPAGAVKGEESKPTEPN